MKKLITMPLVLCFCMLQQGIFAQEQVIAFGNTYHLEMMHTPPIDTLDQSGRFLGQTFTLETASFIESIRIVAFDWYSLYGHTGKLTFYRDQAFGEILWNSTVEYSGISRFVENPSLFEGESANSFMSHWNSLVVNPIFEGEKSFEDVATNFPVGQMFDPGVIVVVMELDDYVSVDRPPVFTTFLNCVGFWCQNQADPYLGGSLLTDNVYNFFINANQYTPMMDLAFEVKIQPELTTSVGQSSGFSDIRLPMRDGVLTIPDEFASWRLLITDLLGRELVTVPSLVGGQSVSIESMINQVVIVSFLSKEDERKTAKILVH